VTSIWKAETGGLLAHVPGRGYSGTTPQRCSFPTIEKNNPFVTEHIINVKRKSSMAENALATAPTKKKKRPTWEMSGLQRNVRCERDQ